MVPAISDLELVPEMPPTPREQAKMAEAARYLQHSFEDWYHSMRRKLADSRLLLEPVILKPTCDECLIRMELPTTVERCANSKARNNNIAVVLPAKTRPERFALYDRRRRLIYLWRKEAAYPEWWRGVQCTDCWQPIRDSGDIFSVYEEPFAEYVGLPDREDSPRTLRGGRKKNVRERLAKIYGGRCFECGKRRKLTLDHIEPKALGGTWLTTNLQPFCSECQRKKADFPVEKVVVALDMLLRPPPSDSYDGLVW